MDTPSAFKTRSIEVLLYTVLGLFLFFTEHDTASTVPDCKMLTEVVTFTALNCLLGGLYHSSLICTLTKLKTEH